MGQIFLGIIIVAVGFLMVKKPGIARDLIGRLEFFEKVFMGGSTFGFQFVGVLIILIGLSVITNTYGGMINWTLNFIYGR
jgi:hypothetical protein